MKYHTLFLLKIRKEACADPEGGTGGPGPPPPEKSQKYRVS